MKEYAWYGWIQYNGEDSSIYEKVEFPVSEELYKSIQAAIAAGKHLSQCEFYSALKEKLIEAFDHSDYDDDDEKPLPEDYDDKAEYADALQEYEACHEGFEDRYSLVDSSIFDPAEERDFKSKFIGKYSPVLEEEGSGITSYEFSEDFERIVNYTLEIEYNEDGIITDITSIEAEGMESESVNSSRWGACHPDYDFLADELAEELEIDIDDVL